MHAAAERPSAKTMTAKHRRSRRGMAVRVLTGADPAGFEAVGQYSGGRAARLHASPRVANSTELVSEMSRSMAFAHVSGVDRVGDEPLHGVVGRHGAEPEPFSSRRHQATNDDGGSVRGRSRAAPDVRSSRIGGRPTPARAPPPLGAPPPAR